MNTYLKTSLCLASSLFFSNNALAHCNQLAIIGPKDVKNISVVSSEYLQNKDPEPVGNVLMLERLSWWQGGGITQPLKAEVLIEKTDGSTLKALAQQGYCNWIGGNIAANSFNIINTTPIPSTWKPTHQNYMAEHRDAPGRIVVN